MPTYDTRFYFMDPANPPAGGTALNYSVLSITDNNSDGDFDRFNGDSVNGVDISSSYSGDVITVNVPGTGNVTYTGTTFYLANGQVVFTPEDGQPLKNSTFVQTESFENTQGPLFDTELGPACFTAGTRIETENGPVSVEELRPGVRVKTLDSGYQSILWIGDTRMRAAGEHAPIRFAKGAIGNDAALSVSPEHRMLVTGWKAQLLTGEDEILIAAKHLVNGDTICRVPGEHVHYFHLLFDRHHIIESHGALSESFYPGHAAHLPSAEARLSEMAPIAMIDRRLARPELKGFEAHVMAA